MRTESLECELYKFEFELELDRRLARHFGVQSTYLDLQHSYTRVTLRDVDFGRPSDSVSSESSHASA